MRWVVVILIRMYWMVPKRWRRRCIFKKTCSHYVYEVVREQGMVKGVQALRERMGQCRPGYGVYVGDDGVEWVVLGDGVMVERGEMRV